jgi:hypothetical protein
MTQSESDFADDPRDPNELDADLSSSSEDTGQRDPHTPPEDIGREDPHEPPYGISPAIGHRDPH